ncbi:ATP-binding protein [Streptomyces lydicus]|uniref:ATP-binding protein n=1 Tax=Streptomyces lydicus TaxID=47763 RepID=UPI00379F5DF1
MIKGRDTTASGAASVAIGADANGTIITNPTTINVLLPRQEETSPPSVRPRLLPPEVSDFTGRTSEIELLSRHTEPSGNGKPTLRAVITGKPGVGKTTLAVHTAYRAYASFPDGDLYADLRGADETPAPPEELMGRFMRSLGVPEEEIPGDPHSRLDAYRRVMADRALIMVLDNASDEKQVRPLVPPGSSTLVLITSRSQLRGLEGFTRIDLDSFPAATSLDFLRKVTGEDTVNSDPQSAREVIVACGHLPLALRISANILSSSRNMRMTNLAAELRDQRDRLGTLQTGDLSVRAAFNLSYRKLGKGAKNAFKRLSSVPSEDFGAELCAALTDCGDREARKVLDKLAEANLIEPSSTFGRFRFHDLLRVYSQEKAGKDSDEKNSAAVLRMLEWLRNSSVKAHFAFIGQSNRVGDSKYSAKIDSIESAASWVRGDLQNAVAAINVALHHESPEKTVALVLSLSAVCEVVGDWQAWGEVIRLGIGAARKLDDPSSEVMLLTAQTNLARYRREFAAGLELAQLVYERAAESSNDFLIASSANLLACLKMDCGLLQEGLPLLEESLAIYQRLGIEHEIAQVLYNLGTIHRAAGNTKEAVQNFEKDLEVCLNSGDESGAAETMNTLALTYVEMGNFEKAEKLQRGALEIFKRIGNPHKLSMVSNDLGITLRHQDRKEEALALHLDDIALSRQVGNQSGEALAQANAAACLQALGRAEEAESRFHSAVAVFRDLGDRQRLARTLISQVPLLFSVGKAEVAEEYVAKAVSILEEYGDLRDVASAHQVLAKEYSDIEAHEKALLHAKKSLQIANPSTSPLFRAASYVIALGESKELGAMEDFRELTKEFRDLIESDPELVHNISDEASELVGRSSE